MKARNRSLLLAALCSACFAQTESLLIGPGDRLHVQVFDTPEMEQHPKVTDAGEVPLLFLGNVKIAGMTPADASYCIEEELKKKHYMLHPQVSVTVETYATQQVSILGQVLKPGVYDISTGVPITTVLSQAGGLTELADRHITVERSGNPKKTTEYFLSNHSDRALNDEVLVYPGDTILVPRVGIVYVLGDVGRPGGFPMSNNDSQLTVLEALATAGAANKSSVLSKARLIRRSGAGTIEIPLQLSSIQTGRQPDIALRPDDIVFVPFSYMKNVLVNSTQIAASAASAVIYAHP